MQNAALKPFVGALRKESPPSNVWPTGRSKNCAMAG